MSGYAGLRTESEFSVIFDRLIMIFEPSDSGEVRMICDVLLTKKDKKFIARVCQYPEIVAEDDTEKGVLTKARIRLGELLSGGRIVKIDTGSEPCEHPWIKYAGMFADDSDWEPFQESLRQYREETDSVTDEA